MNCCLKGPSERALAIASDKQKNPKVFKGKEITADLFITISYAVLRAVKDWW